MTTRTGTVTAGLGALAVIGLAAATLHARESVAPMPVSSERLMYLRSGKTADRLFLSFDALASDVYWIRSIQHYGRDRKSSLGTGRFEFLAALLDLTTTLDPHFNRAYRFGAIFLALDPPAGPGRPDQAIALLEKGLVHNPARWQYAHDIGFIHYWFTGDFRAASDAFDRAARLPRAPEWIAPMVALTRARGGDRPGARRLLANLLEADEKYIRDAAARSLAQLNALDAIDQLSALITRFHERWGRYPEDWTDLIRAEALRGVPADPTGTAFVYDAAAHTVTLSPASPLSPLPPAFAHK